MAKIRKELSDETKNYIVSLIDNGLRVGETSKLLGLNRSTVGKVYKRFQDRKSVENRPRNGRPKKFTDRCVSALSRIVKKDRTASVDEISNEFRASTSVEVCNKTITRKLHSWGYSKHVQAKKMGIREVNRKKRRQYCRGKLHWTVANQWKKVIFSDEMTIIIKPDGRVKLWRKADEKWSVFCLGSLHVGPKTTLKLMVWGCITYNGVGPLVFVEGNMDSVKYCRVLNDHFLPFVAERCTPGRWYLQEDNASIHRSAYTEDWKKRQRIPAFFWPPQSPDLNPIENVWNALKNYVKKHLRDIHTTADLRGSLTTCWNGLSLVYLRSLYSSLPRRCQQVLRMKGHITKY